MNYTKITNNTDIHALLSKWNQNRIKFIALDIEAESNLHHYGEKLCLVQVFDGKENIIIDPFKIKRIHIKNMLENPHILKIMYDATSDLSLLKNAHDMEIKSILDLRPAVELLDYERKDLHSIIAKELNINLDKKKRYQQYNWTKRPLPEDVISYALNDVIHLFKLKEAIFLKLSKHKIMDEYILKNLQIQIKDYKRNKEDKYNKIKGYNRLNKIEKNKAKNVFDIRDKHAKDLNVPPNNVIPNNMLIDIVKRKVHIHDIPFSIKMREDKIRIIIEELKKVFN